MSYSANVFDLLGDEGDDHRPRVKQAAKPASASQAPTKPAQATSSSKPPAHTNAPANTSASKKENEKPKAPQVDAQKTGGKPEGAVKKGPAQPRQPREGGARNGEFADRPPRQPREGGEHREPREPREGREQRERRERGAGGEGRPPRGGRQFDRRSGTGRPPTENKRQGHGKGNWGRIEEEAQVVQETPAEAPKETTDANEEHVTVETEAPVDAGDQSPKEPEKEYKGLDEYYEMMKQKAVKRLEAPKLRAAGEGVDQSAWEGYAPLAKDEVAESNTRKKATKKDANGKEETKNSVAADLLNFTMPPVNPDGGRDRRGRGGKSFGSKGGRGGGGRGSKFDGGRGPRGSPHPNEPRLNPKDDAEFPSLAGSSGAPAPAQSPKVNA